MKPVKVRYYADRNGGIMTAEYVNREVAERAIERAASLLGWIGIIL